MSPRVGSGVRVALLILLAVQGICYGLAESHERAALRALVAAHVGSAGTPEQRVQRTTALAFSIPEHSDAPGTYGLRNPLSMLLRPSAMQVYREGGRCTGRSRLLAELLSVQGIPARKLYLYEPLGLTLLKDPPRAWVHVAVEARIGDRWVVADPLFNIVFRRPDGHLATAQELARDPALVAAGRRCAEERFDGWEDRLYTYAQVRRFPWFVIPVVGESLRALLVSVMSAATVDAWATPGWLERPQLTIAGTSWALAGFLGLTLLIGRRTPARRTATPPSPVPLPTAGNAPAIAGVRGVAPREPDDREDPRRSA